MSTIRITMRSTAAGPGGAYNAGATYDVPADVADAFLEGGYAERVPRASAETATPATASVEAADARPRAKRRGES